MRLMSKDNAAHHANVHQRLTQVDAAGINRKMFALPREISEIIYDKTEKSAEVIVIQATSLKC